MVGACKLNFTLSLTPNVVNLSSLLLSHVSSFSSLVLLFLLTWFRDLTGEMAECHESLLRIFSLKPTVTFYLQFATSFKIYFSSVPNKNTFQKVPLCTVVILFLHNI